MEKYSVLYFSSGYSSVHKQIIDAIRLKDNSVIPCLYTLHYSKRMFECPTDAIAFNNKSLMRGMFFWKRRLDAIVDYYDKKINWDNIDVLHAHLLYTDGYICRKLSQRHKIPFVVTIRNTDINTKYYVLPNIKREMFMTLKKASKIIYLGEEYKNRLLERLTSNLLFDVRKKLMQIPNGVDDFWHDNNNTPKHREDSVIKLLTVGRIEKNKNQISVCKAVENLIDKGYQVEYVLVGDCKDNNLKEIISAYSWTKMIPFQEKNNLIKYYREADIYVMPSKTETFGLVYVEALTQGLPIIYTKGQGFDGQFQEGVVGFHVDANNINDIESAIIRICKQYEDISARCVKKSEKYKWTYIGESFRKAYQESIYGNGNSL